MLVGMEWARHLRAGPWPHTEQRADVDDRWDAQQRVRAGIALTAIAPATFDGSSVDLGSMCGDVGDVEADRRLEPERFHSGGRAARVIQRFRRPEDPGYVVAGPIGPQRVGQTQVGHLRGAGGQRRRSGQ